MKEKVIVFLKVAGISLAAFLCICWTAGTESLNAYWSEALVFFVITFFMCEKFASSRQLGAGTVAIASAVGRIILEIPIRISDWLGTVGSLMLTLESLVAIFMAWVCWKYKKPVVFILTLVIFILINSFIPEMWDDFLMSRRHH